MNKTDKQSPAEMIVRGRKLFLGIVLIFVLMGTAALAIRITDAEIVRFVVGMVLLFAAWQGQQWAIALVAMGCALGALLTFASGLSSGSPAGLVLGILFALIYGGIFLVFLKSESLNLYLKQQALLAAKPSPDDRD